MQLESDIDILQLKVTHGFSILLVREFLLKVLAFGGQVLLARILVPKDFGYYVILVFIVNFMALFSDIGLSTAIIQREKKPTDKQLSTIFYVQQLLSVTLIILVFILAPVTKFVFPSFGISQILMLRIFSITILTASIRSVPISLLERKISYSAISQIDIVGVAIYYLTVLWFASQGFGVWSFIYAALAKEVVEILVVFAYTKWLPIFYFQLKEISDMMKFGSYIQGGGALSFINSSITPVIGGINSGPQAVGLLDWSSTIAGIPETVTNNFGRVAFAGFSRIQKDIQLIQRSLARSISLLSIIMLLFAVIIFGYSYDAAKIFYHNIWLQGIPYLYWFAGSIFFHAVMAAYGQGILVLGKSKSLFYATLFSTILGWILAYVLVKLYGPIGIAAASFFISMVLFGLYIHIAHELQIHVGLFKILFPKILVFAASFLLAVVLRNIFKLSFTTLFVEILATSLFYLLLMTIFSKKDMANLIGIIKSVLKNALI